MGAKKGVLHKDRMVKSSDDFWKYVDRRGDDECWAWLKGKNSTGYGSVRIDGIKRSTHRVAFYFANGGIDLRAPMSKKDPSHVLHRCDNRLCCNPKHLFLGSHDDNMKDMVAKGRSKAPRGDEHPMAKLTNQQAQEIREMLKSGLTNKELRGLFKVGEDTIRRIGKGIGYAPRGG